MLLTKVFKMKLMMNYNRKNKNIEIMEVKGLNTKF